MGLWTDQEQGEPPELRALLHPTISGSAPSRLTQWFNTARFVQPGPCQFENEPRVDPTLRAQGVANYDFSAAKKTAVTEEHIGRIPGGVLQLLQPCAVQPAEHAARSVHIRSGYGPIQSAPAGPVRIAAAILASVLPEDSSLPEKSGPCSVRPQRLWDSLREVPAIFDGAGCAVRLLNGGFKRNFEKLNATDSAGAGVEASPPSW